MAGYTKTFTLDFTASGDTVYTGTDKLEDNIDDIISFINYVKKNYSSASAPTSPAPDEGQLWWDSTNDAMYVYTGSAWTAIGVDTYKVMVDSGDGTPGYVNAKVQNSIVADETNHKIHLSGDSASPGNYAVYGTSAGTKGWIASIDSNYLASDAVSTAKIASQAVSRGANAYSETETTLSGTTETTIASITITLNTTSDVVHLYGSAAITQRCLPLKGTVSPVYLRIRRTNTSGAILCAMLITGSSDIALGDYPLYNLIGADTPATTGNYVYVMTATHYVDPIAGTPAKLNYKGLFGRAFSK